MTGVDVILWDTKANKALRTLADGAVIDPKSLPARSTIRTPPAAGSTSIQQ